MIEFLLGLVGIGEGWAALGYIDSILNIIGAFAVLASQTPNKVDDRILQVVCDVVNTFGFNLGKARNQ